MQYTQVMIVLSFLFLEALNMAFEELLYAIRTFIITLR